MSEKISTPHTNGKTSVSGSNAIPSLIGEILTPATEVPMSNYMLPGHTLSPESLAAYYNLNVKEAEAAYDANDWAEPEQMYSQFDFLMERVDLNGKSILDVGSGNGLFYEYLLSKGIKPGHFTAIDIASEQIRVIRERFPAIEAIADDFFKYEFEQSYDVVTMFGVAPCLKFMFPNKNRISSLVRLLDRAIRYAQVGVSMSFLNRNCYERCEEEQYEYTYHYPEEVCTLLSGARFEVSTVHNDLVSNCFVYCEDSAGEPFRFNLNRIDDLFGILK